jgi:ribosome-binding protein aMBF1 (putative translation factor)
MDDWDRLKSELMKDKEFKKEYERLAPRYALISQLIEARAKKGFSQKDLAQKIGTKQSAIARLESGNTNPSVAFLEKIASAMGYRLSIQIK